MITDIINGYEWTTGEPDSVGNLGSCWKDGRLVGAVMENAGCGEFTYELKRPGGKTEYAETLHELMMQVSV